MLAKGRLGAPVGSHQFDRRHRLVIVNRELARCAPAFSRLGIYLVRQLKHHVPIVWLRCVKAIKLPLTGFVIDEQRDVGASIIALNLHNRFQLHCSFRSFVI
jgi:hypothetical protein